MGVQLREILVSHETSLEELKGKVIIIDAYNILYQFLSSIRGPDGALFTDSKGRVTSHLIGLLSRNSRLIEEGIKPVYVFDGKVPELKLKVLQERKAVKIEAAKQYAEAVKDGDVESMRKFAARTVLLTKDMVAEAKMLLGYMGIPVIDAPSEGEAQAAFMVKHGDGFAVGSQDFDSLVDGAPRLLQNLSIQGRRKKIGGGTVLIKPLIFDLQEKLKHLGINEDQLLALSMLIGTDYNPGGIKGIGPKKGLALVREFKNDFEVLFNHVKWKDHCEDGWKDIWNVFRKMPVKKDYNLKWNAPDVKKIKEFLVKEREFSEDRIAKSLQSLAPKPQKGLGDYG